ncbi:Na+/H+-dicarboxylate symporter [Bradyrhizobium sp. GM0.4]
MYNHRQRRSVKAAALFQPSGPWYNVLYIQVLIAILIGVLVGWLWPSVGTNSWVKALGDGFIKLIKMVIAPIIFCTVVSGIAHVQDARKVGRVGVKALLYFEIVSTFALILGLVMGNLVQAGHGLAPRADAAAVANYVKRAEGQKAVDFLLNIIPDSVVGALARGDVLQVLLFAILFGFSLMALGQRGERMRSLVDDAAHAVFGVIRIVMKAAPIGAFGAMAYTIGEFGPSALGKLISLVCSVLCDSRALRDHCAWPGRALGRFFYSKVHLLHQG